jgi:hypothetical protein
MMALGVGAAAFLGLLILPLLLFGAILLSDRFRPGRATRLARLAGWSLHLQWAMICTANLCGGLVLAATGVWIAAHSDVPSHRLIGACILIPGGLWRGWHGLRGFRA